MTKMDGDKTTQEGLCIKCAMELNIGPIKQIIESMGISEDEFDEVSEQFNEMFENGSFEPGGAGTMPFMQNISAMFGNEENANSPEDGKSSGADTPREKKRKMREKEEQSDKKMPSQRRHR